MTSKTPQFDALLQPILNALVPHMRTCKNADKSPYCENGFAVEADDIDFYKMLRVPPPTFCPTCRHQRRLAFSNYSNIYKRKCDVSGHTETMISAVAPVMPWVTYDYDTYYSDAWDPREYGCDVDSNESFFEQFLNLEMRVPQPGVRRGADSPNSDYSFYGKHMKDCYYVFGGRRNEDIMYGSSIYDSLHVVDAYYIRYIDVGYEHVGTHQCSKCFFSYFSSNCIECEFIFDCRNCQNCFGCTNLRNKNYCWFNEQLTKEEYQRRRAEVDLGSQKVKQEFQKKFWDFVRSQPVRATRQLQSEDVSGTDIRSSKNCHHVSQVESSENIKHCHFAIAGMVNSMDMGFGGKAENIYDCQNTGTSSMNVRFSFAVKEAIDSDYLLSCSNCINCFGCIGLKNASYMIFNKQYSEEEYWTKLDEVKSAMLARGEYGEFFPMHFSCYAYNSSLAQFLFPLSKEDAAKWGVYFQDETDVDMSALTSIHSSELPDNIQDFTADMCKLAIVGESSGKPFRVTERELEFYKRYNIALPLDTPYERIARRFTILNNFRLVPDHCVSCGVAIESGFPSTDGWRPYCETCYQKEIL
jgi:hypothetical protein